jgi:branched-chain amino acid transport system substrate-binding protein
MPAIRRQMQEGGSMHRGLNRWAVALAAVSLLAVACQQQEEGDGAAGGAGGCPEGDECVEVASGAPIRIGTLLAISGDTASLGLDSQHGAELGADYLDGTLDATPGQIAGHDVEFQHEDDQCAAEGGQAGGRRLASDPTIVAVIGTSCSSSALGVADQILGDAQIPLISPSNTSPALTDPATHNEFYLRTAHNDLIQGAAMAQFASEELGAQTAATIHDGSPYADGLQQVFCDSFTADYGGTCTTQEAVQVGDTDFVPLLTRIAGDEPDLLYYPIFLPEGGLITQQARDVEGLANTDLAGADGMLTSDFVPSAGAAGDGVFLSGPSLEFSGDFYTGEFLPAYEEQYGEEPTAAFHAHSFDAFNILTAAIEEVAVDDGGTTLIPRQGLLDRLYETAGYEGIVGTFTCNENGDCLQSDVTMAVNEVEGGEIDNPIFDTTFSLEEVS